MGKEETVLGHITKHLGVVIGLVLVWRGIWHLLDTVDEVVFRGNDLWTSIGGIILGLAILYIPDKDLKELGSH